MQNIFLLRFWVNLLLISSLSSYLHIVSLFKHTSTVGIISNFLFVLSVMAALLYLLRLEFNSKILNNSIKILIAWSLFLTIYYSVSTFTEQAKFVLPDKFLVLPLAHIFLFIGQLEFLKFLQLRVKENILIINDGSTNKYDYANVRIIKILPIEDREIILQTVKHENISKVIFDIEAKKIGKMIKIKNIINKYPLDIFIINKNNISYENQISVDYMGVEMLLVSSGKIPARPLAALIKRFSDFIISLLLIILLAPLMLAIMLLIKLESPGPAIYEQNRNGINGKFFTMYKFRSMYLHESEQLKQASKGDKRISWIGSIIRRSSLDELPQLFNVLLGDMSLVGPRPHASEHNIYYEVLIDSYMLRHKVRPGMTGLAQINGLRGETKELKLMEDRVKYDLQYIDEWSLLLDLKILLATPISLLKNESF